MESPLTDAEITRISTILCADSKTVGKKYEICKTLGLPQSEIDELKHKLVFNISYGILEFFKDVLSKYVSANGPRPGATVQSLKSVLGQLGLKEVNETLDREYAVDCAPTPMPPVIVPVPQKSKLTLSSVGSTYAAGNKINMNENFMQIQLLQGGILAVQILKIVSFFQADTEIPLKLFDHIKPTPRPGEFDQAINILTKFFKFRRGAGTLNVDGENKVVRSQGNPEEVISSLDSGLQLLNNYLNQCRDDGLVKAIIPHVMSVWKHSLEHDKLVTTYCTLPIYLCAKLKAYGRYETMLELARNSIPRFHQVFGKHNAYTLRITYREGVALYHLSRYSESVTRLKVIYQWIHFSYHPPNELKMNVLHYLSRNMDATGNYDKQLELLTSLENLKKKVYGASHLETLKTQFYKALVFHKLKRLDEALILSRYVHEMQKQEKEEYEFNMQTCILIGRILLDKGNVSEALRIFQSIEIPLKRIFGENHSYSLKNSEYIRACMVKINSLIS